VRIKRYLEKVEKGQECRVLFALFDSADDLSAPGAVLTNRIDIVVQIGLHQGGAAVADLHGEVGEFHGVGIEVPVPGRIEAAVSPEHSAQDDATLAFADSIFRFGENQGIGNLNAEGLTGWMIGGSDTDADLENGAIRRGGGRVIAAVDQQHYGGESEREGKADSGRNRSSTSRDLSARHD
jgi:hypothetical protein